MRIIHGVFIVNVVILVVVAEFLAEKEVRHIDQVFYSWGAVTALVVVIAGFLTGRNDELYSALRGNRHDQAVIATWTKRHIILFAMSESVAFAGFIWRVLGTPLPHCVPFYVAGIVLLLLSAPRKLD